MKFLFSLFALIMFTESCNSSKETIENSNKMQNTLSGNYTITQVGDNKSISPKLMISFDEKLNKVTGFSGCNNFFGTYTTQGNSITFSKIAASKKLCQNEIMTIENQFLKILNRVNSFTIKNGVLSFLENETSLLKVIKKITFKTTKTKTIKKSDVIRGNYGTSVTYQVSSRGLFEYFNISESKISFSTDRNLLTIKKYPIDEKDWIELKTLIDAVDMESFQNLKAPTDKRSTDAALSANLAIQIGDVYYMAPEFDHGNPPKKIEAIVNKVLSIKENTIKQ